MKIAYISDIHSNLEALETSLQEISRQDVDHVYCLGDIVGYGADPNACIDLIREVADGAIAGNHDSAAVGLTSTEHFNSFAQAAIRWTDERLTESNRQYLKNLPLICSNDSVFCVHATPIAPEK
ncbi:MAG: metallophosphoesterase family protein, partial [Candidatus Marinimicrobia bacterium]|nr:metallophosphoesterase family protein [Candidatus Neomarinimicrobiota bacterium]